jgi:hypothetical protein
MRWRSRRHGDLSAIPMIALIQPTSRPRRTGPCAVHGPVVGEHERSHPLVGHALGHRAEAAQPVEQSELRLDVKVDEGAVASDIIGLPRR